MHAIYWSYQKELILLEKKLNAQRLESKNKIEEYKSRIKSIRDESKIETERIIAEKINRSNKSDRIKEDMREKRAKRAKITSCEKLIP